MIDIKVINSRIIILERNENCIIVGLFLIFYVEGNLSEDKMDKILVRVLMIVLFLDFLVIN